MKKVFAGLLLGIAVFCAVIYFPKKSQTESEPSPCRTWTSFNQHTRLQMILKGFAIQSMIDLPVSDVSDVHQLDLGVKRYLGVANTPDLARSFQIQFGSKEKEFQYFRVDVDVLPKADLVLAWDFLCTMPSDRIFATLLQLKKSGAKFLLMRHYPQVEINDENQTGTFIPVNWNLPPYNFPEPIIHIAEEGQAQTLALWSLDTL